MNSKVLGGIVVALLCVAGAFWYFNTGYGETTEQGYAYSLALFSACNQKDKDRLREISASIAEDLEAGTIGSQESGWLNAIIDKGLNDQWESANKSVRQIMEDQVRPNPEF